MEIQAAPVEGAATGLTILVQFPDDPSTPAPDPTNFPADRAKIVRFCNDVGYAEDGNTGSVRDYFADQSNHLLTYTQSVTQIITLPNARISIIFRITRRIRFCAKWGGGTGRLVIQHAVDALQAAGFDFSNLSVDGTNGRVLATNVMFAGSNSGGGREDCGPTRGICRHPKSTWEASRIPSMCIGIRSRLSPIRVRRSERSVMRMAILASITDSSEKKVPFA